jgi:hypothetical protein
MPYARANEAGTACEPIRRPAGVDGSGGLAIDPAGNVYVAWHASAKDAAPGGTATVRMKRK